MPRFAELFPALTFIDVSVNPTIEGRQVLQQLLLLPQLATAHFRFSGEFVMGLHTKQLSRLVLAPPDTVALHIAPFEDMEVDLVQAKDTHT